MDLAKRTNQFARVISYQKNGKKGIGVQYYTDEGMFYGQIWTLFTRQSVLDERINYVQSLPYCAKLKGFHVYLTLSYFSGPKGMSDRYDLQDIADKMLSYYYETYLKNKEKLLKICAEQE